MKNFATYAILLSVSVFAAGCGASEPVYQEPPENADVSEAVQEDAGVVTDDELMSKEAEPQ